jgi:phosphoglucosamine mutase
MGKLFGTDGIRGEANRPPMDGPTGFSLGKALGKLFGTDGGFKVVLGKDTRISGDMLESSVASGIASAGGDVLCVGVLPTPGVAYLSRALGASAGVMISASHNPFQDNGFKVFSGEGFKLSDDEEAEVEKEILEGVSAGAQIPPEKLGRIVFVEKGPENYKKFLLETFPKNLNLNGLRLILDTANGATSGIAPSVFTDLGVDVEVIHNHPDGVNINEACGSEHTEDLEARVAASGADLGLAFDGDGDRLIAVDESGNRLTGDQVLMILACDLKDRNQLTGDLLVTTVMSNLGLSEACRNLGIKHHASSVGDRFVLEHMHKLGGILGGEDSGHMIFLNHHTTGDGILSGLQLLSCLARKGEPLSRLSKVMNVFPQELINVDVTQKPEISTIPEIVEAINQVEKELGEKGRVLVRYSGTQNVCRVMVEGPGDEVTKSCCRRIADAVKKSIG